MRRSVRSAYLVLPGILWCLACQVPNPSYDPLVRHLDPDGGQDVPDGSFALSDGAHDSPPPAKDTAVMMVDAASFLPDAPSAVEPPEAAAPQDAVIANPAPDAAIELLPPAPAHLRVGLVGYWPLDRALSGSTSDHSGNGNHAAIEHADVASAFVAGKFGNAVTFAGATGPALRVSPSASVNAVAQGITLAAWIAPRNPRVAMISSVISRQYGDASHDQYDLAFAGGDLDLYMFDPTFGIHRSVFTRFNVTANQWVHVAASYDGTTMRLYVSGVLRASGAFPLLLTTSNKPLYIGTNINDGNEGRRETMDGLIDEVLVYDRALSDAEVMELATRVLPLWQ